VIMDQIYAFLWGDTILLVEQHLIAFAFLLLLLRFAASLLVTNQKRR